MSSGHDELAVAEIPRRLISTYDVDGTHRFTIPLGSIAENLHAPSKSKSKVSIRLSGGEKGVSTSIVADGKEKTVGHALAELSEDDVEKSTYTDAERFESRIKKRFNARIVIDADRFKSIITDITAVDKEFVISAVDENKAVEISASNAGMKREFLYRFNSKVGTCTIQARSATAVVNGEYSIKIVKKDIALAGAVNAYNLYLGNGVPLELKYAISDGNARGPSLDDAPPASNITIKHFIGPCEKDDADEMFASDDTAEEPGGEDG